MNGGYDGKFPQGRALYLYMMAHPGKKLDFMGNEFGQLREWDESRPQDWELFRFPNHDGFYHFRQELGRLYRQLDAFWDGELDPDNFAWLDCDSAGNGTFALIRHGRQSCVFAAFCFGDAPPLPLPADAARPGLGRTAAGYRLAVLWRRQPPARSSRRPPRWTHPAGLRWSWRPSAASCGAGSPGCDRPQDIRPGP